MRHIKTFEALFEESRYSQEIKPGDEIYDKLKWAFVDLIDIGGTMRSTSTVSGKETERMNPIDLSVNIFLKKQGEGNRVRHIGCKIEDFQITENPNSDSISDGTHEMEWYDIAKSASMKIMDEMGFNQCHISLRLAFRYSQENDISIKFTRT